MNPETLAQLKQRMTRKTMGCPFFIAGSLCPLITYLSGVITWREVAERAQAGHDMWRRCSAEDQADLAESYYQEGDAIEAVLRALARTDPDTPEGDAALRADILTIVQDYLTLPEVERKVFFL